MAIISSGINDGTLLEIDPTFNAVKVGGFYVPENSGVYRATLTSGTIASATGAGIIFAFQNPSSIVTAIILDVRIGFRPVAAATAGSQSVSLWATRSYTAIDTTGAAAAPTYKGQQLSSIRGEQFFANMRIANTGMISGGTGNDDSQALSGLVFPYQSILAPGAGMLSFFSRTNGNFGWMQYPLVCAQNEGFRIRADTVFPTSDTEVAKVDVEWVETTSF